MGGVTHESSIPGTIGGKSGRRDKQTKSGTIQGNPGRLASMLEGKTKAALCLITEQDKGGFLHLNNTVKIGTAESQTVLDILRQ